MRAFAPLLALMTLCVHCDASKRSPEPPTAGKVAEEPTADMAKASAVHPAGDENPPAGSSAKDDSSACAAQLPEGIRGVATPLHSKRAPLDLDLDGTLDELLVYTTPSANGPAGDAWLIARLTAGWTTPVLLGSASPALVLAPDGNPAGADLDRNGRLEFFVTAAGNTARNAAMITTAGCHLKRVLFEEEDDDEFAGLILIGVGGNSCGPTGCRPRVRCDDESLAVELAAPVPGRPDVTWATTRYRLVGGTLVRQEHEEVRFPRDAWPAAAPSRGDSDVIDCTPPGGR